MNEVRCKQCPLRRLPLFLDNSADEISLVQSLKRREARLRADEILIYEGQTDAPLFTLLDGWAFRYKTLRDGRRQILNMMQENARKDPEVRVVSGAVPKSRASPKGTRIVAASRTSPPSSPAT